MESKEEMRDGSAAEGGNGHAIRFSAASEQFATRSCARCNGLLVNEWCYDLPNTDEYNAKILRCVQCGHRVDPVIVQNQIRSAVESQQVRQARQRYSMRTVILDEVA